MAPAQCVDDLQQESGKLQHYERMSQRQKSAQQQYLAKKKAESQVPPSHLSPVISSHL